MDALTFLCDAPKRYKDVYVNAFSKIAQKDVLLQTVMTRFEVDIKTKLTGLSSSDKTLRILGIGVGGGQYELEILKSLCPLFPSFHLLAIEPDGAHLRMFKSSLQKSDVMDKVTADWFPGTYSDYYAHMRTGLPEMKYDLITSIHSMYHLGPVEDFLPKLTNMLADGGVLLVQVSADNQIINICKEASSLPRLVSEASNSSGRFVSVATSLGYDVTRYPIQHNFDITEVFDETSEHGTKLLDFLTHMAYIRETAPGDMLDRVMSALQTHSVKGDDGRVYACGDEETIILSKRDERT